jgi:tetratricopeptide (TPR) repeat protein
MFTQDPRLTHKTLSRHKAYAYSQNTQEHKAYLQHSQTTNLIMKHRNFLLRVYNTRHASRLTTNETTEISYKYNMRQSSMAVNAINANNAGVCLFERGDFENANHEFANALRTIKEAIASEDHQPNNNDRRCSQDELNIQTEPSSVPAAVPTSNPGDGATHDVVFIYQHAWRIANQEHNIRHSRLTCQALSGIIVCNLALVHHLRAVRWCTTCRQEDVQEYVNLLHKTAKLYSCAQAIHRIAPFMDASRALGTWNNMAHIHTLIGDNWNATKCWEQLLALIVYLSDSPNKDCDTKGPFLGNVMHLILKAPTTPAAA